MVGDADHVAGERLVGDLALAGEEELRRVQRDRLAGAHLLQPHAAHQPARADAGEGDAVAVVGVHVRLDLEHQRGQAGLGRLDHARVGRLRARRRAVFGQAVQQVADADALDGAAEIHRRQVAGVECVAIELRQRGAHQVHLVAQRLQARIGLRQIGVSGAVSRARRS